MSGFCQAETELAIRISERFEVQILKGHDVRLLTVVECSKKLGVEDVPGVRVSQIG